MGQNRGAGCGWGGRPEATAAGAAGRWRGPGGGPPAVAKYRRGGRGSCPCAGGSAEAQLGSGQVTPLENCRPSPLLGSSGHPETMFSCAECWALVMALSKFGTFPNLTGTASLGQGEQPEPFRKGRRWQG